MRGLAIFALGINACGFISAERSRPQLQVVHTKNGDITGHRAPEARVWEFLGIPYAKPPIGSLRFAAPQSYTGKGPFNASKFGYDCPQQAAVQPAFPGFTPQALRILNLFTASAGTERSEDCLTLNVWTSSTSNRRKGRKPVYVHFYGGRFAGGDTNTPFANGQHLADAEDLVVVSVNYRVNVFGFPGAPGADTNLGLRDQRLAVEWVQKNIGAFGGNSKKIIISGQSSGGAAVDWWSYAYKHDPIATGLVSTSGNAFSFPINTLKTQTANWFNLSASLGCGSSGDTLPCMRDLPWEIISKAASKIAASPGGSPVRSTPPFYPLVDNQTIFQNYTALSSSGKFAKIPYLQGHNDHEQGYYVIPAFAQGRNVTTAQAAQFLLESFVCPVSYEARHRVDAKVPTWVYRYFGDWDNTRLYPTSGAYHGTELHMIFGSSQDASGLAATKAQNETSTLFQHAIAAFAHDPQHGLSKIGWPRFNPAKKTWAEIAVSNQPRITFADPDKYDKNCSQIVLGALSNSAMS